MFHFDPKSFVAGLAVIIVSISLHEFGHAISADRLGDPGPRRDGRITLWPDKHFDILGFIMIIGTTLAGRGLGWGKPVMVNPRYFRNPRRDMLIVAACGPLMNLFLAIIACLLTRLLVASGHDDMIRPITLVDLGTDSGLSTIGLFLRQFVMINLSLLFFNLIPLHPLDGSKILSALLPYEQSLWYDRTFMPYGATALLICAFALPGFLGSVLVPPVLQTAQALMGPNAAMLLLG